jgi:outer membrane cobalamin receptor
MHRRQTLRALLLAGCGGFAVPAWAQTTSTPPPTVNAPAAQPPADQQAVSEVVVTGLTSRNRPLITASADITLATRADIERKAPRSTADLLELVPGIFVEGTAGELSNNYSVRGLQGGGQRFIQLQEDGLPVIYQAAGRTSSFPRTSRSTGSRR